MPTSDGILYRADTPTRTIATVDAVLQFAGQRESRTVVHSIPTGGVALVVRPHGPRTGTFRFLFAGADAQTRAKDAETSLATGTRHFLSPGTGEPGAFSWYVTGSLTIERVHEAHGMQWIVEAQWTSA